MSAAQSNVVKPRVFIAYGRGNREYVERLREQLVVAAVDVLWDATFGARGITDQEREYIAQCTHLIVVLTPEATKSKHVKLEIQLAFDDNKEIIPIELETVQKNELPAEIQPIRRLDARDGKDVLPFLLRVLLAPMTVRVETLNETTVVDSRKPNALVVAYAATTAMIALILAFTMRRGADGASGRDGAAGRDAPTVDEVLAALHASPEWASRATVDVDPDVVANRLKMDASFVEKTRGAPGASVTAAEAADQLRSDPNFLTSIKGDPGVSGPPGPTGTDAHAVATLLLSDPEFSAKVKGADGASVSVDQIVAALNSNETFKNAIKGEAGANGSPGPSIGDVLDALFLDERLTTKLQSLSLASQPETTSEIEVSKVYRVGHWLLARSAESLLIWNPSINVGMEVRGHSNGWWMLRRGDSVHTVYGNGDLEPENDVDDVRWETWRGADAIPVRGAVSFVMGGQSSGRVHSQQVRISEQMVSINMQGGGRIEIASLASSIGFKDDSSRAEMFGPK